MTYPPAPEQPEGQERPENDRQPDGGDPSGAQDRPAPSAPETPETFGAPQYPAPPAPPYGAPQAPQYGAPQVPSFAPQPPQAPQAPQYGTPQYGNPQYGAPQAPQYGAPQPAYGYGAAYGEPGPGEPFNGASHPDDLARPLYGATFMQAIKRFFKNYANFTGRASRSEYWFVALFVLLLELVPLVLYIVGIAVMATSGAASSAYDYNSYDGYDSGISPAAEAGMGIGVILMFLGGGLMILIALGILVPSLAIGWRRLHDGNFAGPMYFLSFIPYVGGIIMIVFMCLPSKPEGRRFDTVA